MPDPIMGHLTENWRIYGFVAACGGFGNLVRVHSKNITALWSQKQDKNVCDNEHKHVTDTLERIEKNIEYLVRRNGG